jgi:hypothetical protein
MRLLIIISSVFFSLTLFGEVKIHLDDSTLIVLNDSCFSRTEGTENKLTTNGYLKIGKNFVENPMLKIERKINSKKITAIVITVLTGPLGGHRIYLGTKPVIPVLYALTLGGGIFVTVIDFFALVFTKDISIYINNNSFFMWNN